jgi:protein arginine N-methyltransferase 7
MIYFFYLTFFKLKFDIIFSECAFSLALLPWDNIYFYYGLAHLKSLLPVNDFKEKTVLPKSLKFYAIAVNLENLHKIRSPVRNCEGFNLDEFDKVILVYSILKI